MSGRLASAGEAPADTPGASLRRAREARGLSLEDLARRTKVRTSTLVAIETGDVLRLPAEVYTRGFIKAIARELDLDAAAVTDDYLLHLAVTAAPATHGARSHDPAVPAATVRAIPRLPHAGMLVVFGAAAGVLIYLLASNGVGKSVAPVARPSAPAPVAAATATVPDLSARSSHEPLMDGGPLTVDVLSQGPCWVSARVDGQQVFARLLQAGDRHTLAVGDVALLRVGEPGALTISINGQVGRALGPAGQPVNVRITRENFRTFLLTS